MISLKQLFDLWGFSDHPFEAYTAEKEARLTDYFVSPPYLDDVLGTAESAAPAIVFGTRGIGKSAIRIFTENLCSSGDPKRLLNGRVVAVTHDDFRNALRNGLDHVSLELHIETILQKMVCAALLQIAHKIGPSTPTREAIAAAFPRLDLATFARLVGEYFISLSELQRETAFQGVYDYFKKEAAQQTDRVGWFKRTWGVLRIPLFDVANIIQAVRGKAPISPVPIAKQSVRRAPKESALDDFHSLAAMTSHFDIDAWYVLIDKVDEDEHTDGDAAKAALVVMPLLKNLRVIETQHVAFKFFLWNQLRPTLVENSIRFDKIRNLEMSWTDAELREMINKRLEAFSNGKVKDLRSLVEGRTTIYQTIIKYAVASPREIVHVIDAIFREHARHSTMDSGAMITDESIEKGLDDYCSRRSRDIFPPETMREITRLQPVFTSSDFQQTFKVSKAVASRRINSWIDNGFVKRIDDARSIKDPSKPVYQYEVSEPRLRRILDRSLSEDRRP